MTSSESLTDTMTEAQTLFISYAHEDSDWAEWVGSTLEKNGHSVILARWDFRPGSNFVLEMDRATKESDRTVALLSPAFIVSQYTQPEWAAAFAQDPTGDEGQLIPIRVKDCVLDGLLRQVVYVDLVGLDRATATEKLLEAVSRDRLKPTGEIPFPGVDLSAGEATTDGTETVDVDGGFPEPEEMGFVDYVDLGTSSLEMGNEAGSQFARLIQELGASNLKHAAMFNSLRAKGGGTDAYRSVARSAAAGMTEFVEASVPVLERMGLGWETGLAAWYSTGELLPEFGDVDEDMLRENLLRIDSMIAAIPRTREGVQRMLDSSNGLPRIEKQFNTAKRRVAETLETAIRILDRSLELASQVHDSAVTLLNQQS